MLINHLLLTLQQKFMDKHEKEIKHFGMLEDYMESQDYLIKHPHLACEDTANYLALWCINLEVQEVRYNFKRRLNAYY